MILLHWAYLQQCNAQGLCPVTRVKQSPSQHARRTGGLKHSKHNTSGPHQTTTNKLHHKAPIVTLQPNVTWIYTVLLLRCCRLSNTVWCPAELALCDTATCCMQKLLTDECLSSFSLSCPTSARVSGLQLLGEHCPLICLDSQAVSMLHVLYVQLCEVAILSWLLLGITSLCSASHEDHPEKKYETCRLSYVAE